MLGYAIAAGSGRSLFNMFFTFQFVYSYTANHNLRGYNYYCSHGKQSILSLILRDASLEAIDPTRIKDEN